MSALIAFVVVGLSATVMAFAAIIGVASMASWREDRNRRLLPEARGRLVRLGRRVNGVYVRAPRCSGAAERQTTTSVEYSSHSS